MHIMFIKGVQCQARITVIIFAPINCKTRVPPPPPPPETTGDLTASLYPRVGNLTTRWVTGVGHIDLHQAAL